MNNLINYCVRRLITEVEARPTIWDSRSKEYSDRALKRGAWEELCASFVPNYYKSSDAEKKGIVATMQKKWKSVRDAFLRELKKNANPLPDIKPTKPYAYYENLLFLKPVCEVKPRKVDDDTNSNNETMTVEYEDQDDSDNDTHSRSSATSTELSTQPTPKRKRTEETEDKEDSVFNMLAEHIKNKRKKDDREDRDRQFLLSLLPDLQSMDPHIKFDLKYEIMTVIKRFKDENMKLVATHHQK